MEWDSAQEQKKWENSTQGLVASGGLCNMYLNLLIM
jgi:hypothetical protein